MAICEEKVVAIVTRDHSNRHFTTWDIEIPTTDPLFQQLLEKYGNDGASTCGARHEAVGDIAAIIYSHS